jgi:predicted site-specific integrase-resolvase
MELAERWEMSHRTLQRWRMDGRGPTYLKLGKRVSYPMSSILEFEKHITHISTSQRANS